MGAPTRKNPIKLGEGKFGQVFAYKENKVIKRIKIDHANEDSYKRESQTLLLLRGHPHIVRLDRANLRDGIYWLVLERHKSSLHRVLASFTPQELLSLGAQLCAAVAHCHSHGIAHRDIKPSNILVTGTHLVLSDFGGAKVIKSQGMLHTIPVTTVMYSAPELVMHMTTKYQNDGDLANYDERVDLWALGCTLYEMHHEEFRFTKAWGRNRPKKETDSEAQTGQFLEHYKELSTSFKDEDPKDTDGPLVRVSKLLLRFFPEDRLSAGKASLILSPLSAALPTSLPFPLPVGVTVLPESNQALGQEIQGRGGLENNSKQGDAISNQGKGTRTAQAPEPGNKRQIKIESLVHGDQEGRKKPRGNE